MYLLDNLHFSFAANGLALALALALARALKDIVVLCSVLLPLPLLYDHWGTQHSLSFYSGLLLNGTRCGFPLR